MTKNEAVRRAEPTTKPEHGYEWSARDAHLSRARVQARILRTFVRGNLHRYIPASMRPAWRDLMNSHTDTHGTIAPGDTYTELGTITLHGHDYSAHGAYITDDRIVAYLGSCDVHTYPAHTAHPEMAGCGGPVVTWSGDPIGRYRITKSWRVQARYRGDYRMHQIRVRLDDGRIYHGRSQGPGMVVTGRRERNRRKDGGR